VLAQAVGNTEAYIETLLKARTTQAALLGKLRGEHPDLINDQKNVAADMCCELAQVSALVSPDVVWNLNVITSLQPMIIIVISL
jgi:plasmid maintenance system antidote protein VapI